MKKLFDGPNVISIIVLLGWVILSWLAMKPEVAGVKESVVLYLLGAWQSMAAAVVAFHIGSSASSKTKDDTIKDMAAKGSAP